MKLLLPYFFPAWLVWGAVNPAGPGSLTGQIILGALSAFIAYQQVQKAREDRAMREQDRKDREQHRRHAEEDRRRIAEELKRTTEATAADVKKTAKTEAAKVAVTAERLEKKVDLNTEATIEAAKIVAEPAGNGASERIKRIKAVFDDLRIPPPAATEPEDARYEAGALRPDHRGDAGGGGTVLPGAPGPAGG